jgi:hypothetical protein
MTSSYYRERLHPWVAEFNRGRPADRWFGKDWTRLRPDLDYGKHSGPDDVAGEGTGWFQGRTFPHPTTGGLAKLGDGFANKDYYGALSNSPFGDEVLLDLARRAIDAERLGGGDAPDLLCLSFSGTDTVGHCWGPDSQEVLDAALRADRLVAALLTHLDAAVGRGRYALVLTSDHGICPLPEVARGEGKDAGRVSPERLLAAAEDFLQQTFAPNGPKGRWVEANANEWVYLNPAVLRDRGLKVADVEAALAGWLKQQPGVLAAYTRTRLAAGPLADDPVGERVRRSFHPERCGDVAIVPRPYYLLTSDLTGTLHGSPHAYDTHVPLLVYGEGVAGGVRAEAVSPLAVASILADALRVPFPAAPDAAPPGGLFKK